MYWAAVPFAACFYLLFVPPDGLSETGLFVWLLAFASLTRTAMTFYAVPYLALGAELTRDYDERTLLAALRTVFMLVGMFAVLILGNIAFFGATEEYPNGQLNPNAYLPFALACAPVIIAGVWIAALGTHGQIPHLQQPSGTRRSLLRGVVLDVTTAFKIPAFVAVVAGSIMFSINQGMVQALHLYLATYFFELSSAQITGLFAGAIAGIILGSLCSRPMAALIPEKRNLFIAGTAWYALWTSSVIIARLIGILPGNEHPIVVPLYITTGCISALGLGVAIPLIGSMIADITDEHERRHGKRQEGIYYAAGSLVAKVVGGAGPVLAGVIIDLSGIAPGSAPGDVDPAAIEQLGWATGPSVLLLSALSIACIWFYDISRQRHAEIIAHIDGQRSQSTAP
jgi:Na+/melibiose symporter-like transporter